MNLAAALQVPMSKFEANEFVDDRYAKMSERLEVRRNLLLHTSLYYVVAEDDATRGQRSHVCAALDPHEQICRSSRSAWNVH